MSSQQTLQHFDPPSRLHSAKNRRWILFPILALLLLTVLRETGTVNLGLYHYSMDWKGSNSSSSTTSHTTRRETIHLPDETGEGSRELTTTNQVAMSLPDPDRLSDDDILDLVSLFHEKSVDISLLRFLPLIKPVSFDAIVGYTWTEEGEYFESVHVSTSGQIGVTGSVTVYGLSSGNEVEKIVEKTVDEYVSDVVVAEVRTKLRELEQRNSQ